MRAWLHLRHPASERQRVFVAGLKRLGYKVIPDLTSEPGPKDILVIWNRRGPCHQSAHAFEDRGLPVLVSENACWGNEFLGDQWLHMAKGRHNTSGNFPIGDDARWDSLGVDLAPWRTEGETVVLLQRGIGTPPTAMPKQWMVEMLRGLHGRVRTHPGQFDCIPLEKDLANCGHVVTWGSGAAIKALMWGIPVTSYMPDWIGEQQNDDASRLAMFRRLAWANWRLSEFENGEAFSRMLG